MYDGTSVLSIKISSTIVNNNTIQNSASQSISSHINPLLAEKNEKSQQKEKEKGKRCVSNGTMDIVVYSLGWVLLLGMSGKE